MACITIFHKSTGYSIMSKELLGTMILDVNVNYVSYM